VTIESLSTPKHTTLVSTPQTIKKLKQSGETVVNESNVVENDIHGNETIDVHIKSPCTTTDITNDEKIDETIEDKKEETEKEETEKGIDTIEVEADKLG